MSNKMIKWGSSSKDKEYFMDVNAFMETRVKTRKQGFQHHLHDHLLKLKEVFLDSTNNVICNGCWLFITGCAYYTCSTLDCDFNLHEFCAHVPQNMTHLIHDEPIHKLTPIFARDQLIFYPRARNCELCNNDLLYKDSHPDGICYKCDEEKCSFLVDLRCVASVLAVKDPGHRHALTPHLYPASFLCSICGEKNDDNESLCYICHECCFWVHDSCYPLPRTIQHASHPHPMMVIDSKYRWLLEKCGICKENVEKKYWWYQCASCSYVIHVQCSFMKRNEMVLPKLDEEEVKSMIKLVFPNKKSVHQILTQLVRKLCKTEEEKEDHRVLHHPNIHDCPLVICENNYDNNQVCDACVLPICEPPFYACLRDSCKFFLHKWCANLPKEWKFTHHEYPEHTFVLVEKEIDGFGFHVCLMCNKVGNGFFFKCTKCEDYYIDIKCASLPNFFMHDTHDHPLHLLKTSEHPRHATCYCCVRSIQSYIVYGCVSCHVFLHVGCLWVPQKIEHWYDEHPFSLVYNWPVPISGDGSDDYFCEFCEIYIRNNRWFYHCSECDQSSHINCIVRDLYPMLKFGHCYELSKIHQHPLTCVMVHSRNLGEDMGKPCNFCHDPRIVRIGGEEGWEEMIFECLICKILFHSLCVDNSFKEGHMKRWWIHL